MIDSGKSSFLNDKKADAMINAPISNEMPIVEEMEESNSFIDQQSNSTKGIPNDLAELNTDLSDRAGRHGAVNDLENFDYKVPSFVEQD